ncbi:MAG: sigma 54-interacting transcriptional regulator [Anaerolineae bacterium]|nr:sigma 54-interacting transcriptional regulator [Gemmatimonadaceae bacterium]
MDLLQAVWRDACRHIAIEKSAALIAEHVGSLLPVGFLILRRLDTEMRRLETVAIGASSEIQLKAPARTECTDEQLQTLLDWCRRNGTTSGHARGEDLLLTLLVPAGVNGHVLAGPLMEDDRPLGVLLAVALRPGLFDAAHERLFRSLLEPFSVALGNDSRFHELARLREVSEADNRALLTRLGRPAIADTIVGTDRGLRQVMQRVAQVASTDAPVLLLGETGSGKEVVARAIHSRSRRAGAPVVRVNCGAIPPGLIDSELFGHERGSFTGAVGARKGWFERADGGTLFLDEVAELPLDAQVRLLRILQDGTFERVGGQKALTVDVRIVAATHRDLGRLVAEGRFREDLWYRIGVFPIYIPPLRDRPEDIPALAAHFAWRSGTRLGGFPLAPTQEDIELLLSYHWPGNVRELGSVIERAAILGDGRSLRVAASLGVPAQAIRSASVPANPESAARDEIPAAEILTLDAATTRHIELALTKSGGRVEGDGGAAQTLGVNPHTLRARMRKLGIDWVKFRV